MVFLVFKSFSRYSKCNFSYINHKAFVISFWHLFDNFLMASVSTGQSNLSRQFVYFDWSVEMDAVKKLTKNIHAVYLLTKLICQMATVKSSSLVKFAVCKQVQRRQKIANSNFNFNFRSSVSITFLLRWIIKVVSRCSRTFKFSESELRKNIGNSFAELVSSVKWADSHRLGLKVDRKCDYWNVQTTDVVIL